MVKIVSKNISIIILLFFFSTWPTFHPSMMTSADDDTDNLENVQIHRRKRQESGGGSTSVIGARVTREVTAADWESVNLAAYDTPPPSTTSQSGTRGRRRRGVDRLAILRRFSSIVSNHYSPAISRAAIGQEQQQLVHQHHEHAEQAMGIKRGKFKTNTQGLFSLINKNEHLAQIFHKILGKINPALHDIVIYNSTGVHCDHVCVPHGTGFGMLGLCTEFYCECDFRTGLHKEVVCPSVDTVFDPIKLTCGSPTETILCKDKFQGLLPKKFDLSRLPDLV